MGIIIIFLLYLFKSQMSINWHHLKTISRKFETTKKAFKKMEGGKK